MNYIFTAELQADNATSTRIATAAVVEVFDG